ncbi:MAG: hypothetical protein M0Z80_05240 [Treponema sp.]|nr:hypothetical protein [Treponema sp.]
MGTRTLLVSLLACAAVSVSAWEDHAPITYAALAGQPCAARMVRAETLDAFLAAERSALPAALAGIEAKAKKELDYYPPLPPALAFTGEAPEIALRAAFLAAIRVNPSMPFPLFVQLPPGAPRAGRPPLAIDQADLMGFRIPDPPFVALSPGEKLSALGVVATASDEPDYGMDVGLYADNGGAVGALYGFGKQPFGNPSLSYGSQAPIHMAFPHEDPLIKLAAPFTQRSLSAYRILQYSTLARFAFASGHPYWGWRFAGWALHYVQDLAQPYHASMLPGLSTFQIIWLNLTGGAAAKSAALVLVSNRHTVIEDYLYRAMAAPPGDPGRDRLVAALGMGPRAPRVEPWRDDYAYDIIAWKSYRRAPAFDRLVAATFPAAYVSDPSYDYAAAGEVHDPYDELQARAPVKAAVFDEECASIFADLGSWTRCFVAFASDPKAAELPRREPFDPRALGYLAAVAALAVVIVALARKKGLRR